MFNAFANNDLQFPEISVIGNNSPYNQSFFLEEEKLLYKDILGTRYKVSQEEKFNNIVYINDLQNTQLYNKNKLIMHPGGCEHEFHRKLIAYYRPTQMQFTDKLEVIEIMKFIKYYVEKGYSKLFDTFGVVYRFPETEIVDDFIDNSYGVKGIEFNMLTSIYANTIHFSNGTPHILPGTLPILTTIPYQRLINKNNTLHLPLCYEGVSKMSGGIDMTIYQHKEMEKKRISPQKLAPTLNIVLGVLSRVEEIMLSEKYSS